MSCGRLRQARHSWWQPLADLVLPAVCAGCGGNGRGHICAECMAIVRAAIPRPAAPSPRPADLPPCIALGAYDGTLRSLLLAYKERGAHLLAAPLGRALATGVAAVVGDPATPVALVGVPSTPSAVRERHGDHVARLGRKAAVALRSSGRPAVFVPRVLRAFPKDDSSHLSASARAAAARQAFRVRPARVDALRAAQRDGVAVLMIDDIVTTGSTLASACGLLARAGVVVEAAMTIAATQRWADVRTGPEPLSAN